MRLGLLIAAALAAPALAGCMHQEASDRRATSGDACLGVGEAECIVRSGGKASRKGDALEIRAASGRVVGFTGSPGACAEGVTGKCLVQRLEGFRKDEGLLVVSERRWDAMASVVVDAETGAEVRVDNGPPRFSPGGTRFAGVMSSEARAPANDLAVWSAGGATPALEWSHPTAAGARAHYEFVGWDGEDRVRLRVTYNPVGGGANKQAEAAIVRTENGWTLSKPDDCP